MEFIRGKPKRAVQGPKQLTPQVEEGALPKGYEALPEELRHQPALKERKTMKGVAMPVVKRKPEPEQDDDSGTEDDPTDDKILSDDSDVLRALSGRHRMRTRAHPAKPKAKKIPAHLAMSVSSGSDSDPGINAPGWNLPLQNNRRKRKATQPDSEDELSNDTPPPRKKSSLKKAAGAMPTPAASTKTQSSRAAPATSSMRNQSSGKAVSKATGRTRPNNPRAGKPSTAINKSTSAGKPHTGTRGVARKK